MSLEVYEFMSLILVLSNSFLGRKNFQQNQLPFTLYVLQNPVHLYSVHVRYQCAKLLNITGKIEQNKSEEKK